MAIGRVEERWKRRWVLLLIRARVNLRMFSTCTTAVGSPLLFFEVEQFRRIDGVNIEKGIERRKGEGGL